MNRETWKKFFGHSRKHNAPLVTPETNSRMMLKQKAKDWLALCEEGGKVAIVYGGMDCDCSRWDDEVAIVSANLVTYFAWSDSYDDGAEGPQWHRVCKPSEAPQKSSHRDLALEAFEDGHPHHVYY